MEAEVMLLFCIHVYESTPRKKSDAENQSLDPRYWDKEVNALNAIRAHRVMIPGEGKHIR